MSIHIQAKKGEIAETVLLPGDPKRAEWIAKTFLENPVCYNEIRGMLGFTGTYKGKKISVQATGMGIPSALIYATELLKFYGVKNLIRVGTAGSYQKVVKVNDIVIAMSASSNSGFNRSRFQFADFAPTANFDLLMKATKYARENNIGFHAGNVLTSDDFYEDDDVYKKWARYGVLCVEMETAGLYSVASKFGARAISVLTIADSLVTGEHLSSKDRETSFDGMIKIALNAH